MNRYKKPSDGAQLYLVRLFSRDGAESFYKIGVTGYDSRTRLNYGSTKVIDSKLSLREKFDLILQKNQTYVPDNPYAHEELHAVRYTLRGDALLAERELLARVSPYKYMPKNSFSGQTECFICEAQTLDVLIQAMDEDGRIRNGNAPNLLTYQLQASQVRENDEVRKHVLVLNRCEKKQDL